MRSLTLFLALGLVIGAYATPRVLQQAGAKAAHAYDYFEHGKAFYDPCKGTEMCMAPTIRTMNAMITKLAADMRKVQVDLVAEAARATAAEKKLTDNLAAEVARATAADRTLTTNLAAEAKARIAADLVLQQNIDAEEERATDAEEVLTTNLANEIARATAAEGVLTTNLAAEVTRATAAEGVLTNDLAAEVTRATAAETVLTNDLAAEVTRATAAEGVLTTNLATEVTRALAAEELEQDARIAADVTLQTNINAEATTRAAADTTEATARATADTALQVNIDARTAADAQLTIDLAAEKLARETADTAIIARLPTISSYTPNPDAKLEFGTAGADGVIENVLVQTVNYGGASPSAADDFKTVNVFFQVTTEIVAPQTVAWTLLTNGALTGLEPVTPANGAVRCAVSMGQGSTAPTTSFNAYAFFTSGGMTLQTSELPTTPPATYDNTATIPALAQVTCTFIAKPPVVV